MIQGYINSIIDQVHMSMIYMNPNVLTTDQFKSGRYENGIQYANAFLHGYRGNWSDWKRSNETLH